MYRHMRTDRLEARRDELIDEADGIAERLDEIQSLLEDVEYQLSQRDRPQYDETEADDIRQRAADMNATLRDIGGGL